MPADVSAYKILSESVLAFILGSKSGKFQSQQGRQHTRHLVLACVWGNCTPFPIRVWGIVYLL